MDPIKILIVEDEKSIVEIISLYLEREGYAVYSANNWKEGLNLIESNVPDIALLDINLPDKSGFDLAKRFREISDGVLFFISGEKGENQILKGFDVGCDDYVTKPFDPTELLARIKVHVKRLHIITKPLQIGNLSINLLSGDVLKNNQVIELSKKENMLLLELAKRANEVISTQELFDLVWGVETDSDLKTVSVHIRTLRKKIEDYPNTPQYILTERGFGYRLAYPKEGSRILEG